MFIMGILVQRWITIKFPRVISRVPLADGAYIKFPNGSVTGPQLQKILTDFGKKLSLSNTQITTLQDNLDKLVPGLAALLLTFLCMWLLKKKVSPILIIFGLFLVGIVGHVVGIF